MYKTKFKKEVVKLKETWLSEYATTMQPSHCPLLSQGDVGQKIPSRNSVCECEHKSSRLKWVWKTLELCILLIHIHTRFVFFIAIHMLLSGNEKIIKESNQRYKNLTWFGKSWLHSHNCKEFFTIQREITCSSYRELNTYNYET